MIIRKTAIAGAFLLAAMSNGAVAESTGNDLYAWCTSGADANLTRCMGYIEGLNDGHMRTIDVTNYAYGASLKTKIPYQYCVPMNGTVTMGELRAVIVKYMDQHPEQRHLPASMINFFALRNAYPCPAQ